MEIQEKIFQPFFTTKSTWQGNIGLRLSLTYDAIVKGHRGSIEVESEKGKGTEFLISLPLKQ